ncbi:MAG: ABC transporter substrate-binding protein [Proteobacteria bacterium]|nr:ABC transporter substrate-binding protein [Pseudomonadota bacterium]
MRRRDVLGLLAAGVAVMRAGDARAAEPYRIGVLMPTPLPLEETAFREALRERGYIEGASVVIDVRRAEGALDRLPALAAGLVADRPHVIVAVNTPGTQAALAATRTIPVVMAVVGDPLGMGFVTNLARPGGHVTGVSNLSSELAAKRLSLLKEAVAAARRIAVMLNPDDPITLPQMRDTTSAAPAVGVDIEFFPMRLAQLDALFERMLEWRPDAALWLAGQGQAFEQRVVGLAARRRLPVMHTLRRHVEAGGFMSYFADNVALFGLAAGYVDKILRGAHPGDLPVEQATKFELAINLKTAAALGLTVPPALILRADVVIE